MDELSTSFQVAAEQAERRLRTAGTRLIQLSILTVPIAVFVDLTLVALPAVTAAAVHLWWAPRLRRRFAERLRMVDAARVLLGRPPIGPVDLDAPSGAPVVAACALAALIAAQPGWLTANPAVLLSMAVQVPICTATYAAFLQIHADVVNRTALRLLDVSRPRD